MSTVQRRRFMSSHWPQLGQELGTHFYRETLSESERSTDEDFFGSADDNDGDANNTTSNMPSFLKFLNLKNMAKSDKKSNVRELLKDPDQRLLLTCAAKLLWLCREIDRDPSFRVRPSQRDVVGSR